MTPSGAAGRVIEGAEKSETELSSAPESGAKEPKGEGRQCECDESSE